MELNGRNNRKNDGKKYLRVGQSKHPMITTAIYTKPREFQYKVLNGIFKIGKSESPVWTFCHSTEENMPHLFFHCSFVQNFWNAIQPLFGSYKFSGIDVILRITKPLKDSLLYNQLILQYIYNCKLKNTIPTRVVFSES